MLTVARLFYSGAIIFTLLSIFTVLRVRAEYRSLERLSTPTVFMVWALYFLHAGLTAFAAWRFIWPLPLNHLVAILTGGFLIIVGASIFTAGILEFRSIRRMSGQQNDQLVTSGVYHWSRNPQNVGWMITLLGVSLVGKSGGAILLVALFGLLLHIYIVYVEEGFLEKIYGQAYRRYRAVTARYLGFPGEQSAALQREHSREM